MFRMHGKERLLDKRCGTLPYVSPEVLTRPYSAEPADVWSCGVILVAMLAGELPWDQPTTDCPEYAAWKENRYLHITPWSKLEPVVLSLVRKILVPYPSSRYSILRIKAHGWCRKRFSAQFGARNYEPGAKRACPGVGSSPPVCHSQPEPQDCGRDPEPAGEGVPFSFSQPAALDHLLLSSQFNCTQTSTQPGQPAYQKLVKRMTRFFVRVSCEEVSRQLCQVLEKNACSWKVHTVNMITATSQDKRKMLLVFKAMILDMDGQTLVDLRLSKGCGLEFKRKFLRIREGLGDVVLKGPVMWPIAKATHSLP
ncbi:serine/threonine-protein kinase grp isoform X2 [Bacillus rossius redtenbacheri]